MPLKKISEEIDKFLVIIPRNNEYNPVRQKDTRSILEYVYRELKRIRPMHIMLPALLEDINSICKWETLAPAPSDIEFRMLLEKVKKDLRQVKLLPIT